MKKYISSMAVFAVITALTLSFCSCKKQPPAEQSQPQQIAQTPTPSIPAPAKQFSQPTAVDTALEPIPLVLPRPVFIGTPENIQGVDRLEKPLGNARPPFLAPKGTTNVALKNPVTGSDADPIMGRYAMLTDGDKEAADGSYVEMGPFKQWVQIDLGQTCDIYSVVIWHYHKTARVYFDVVVQVSGDPDFVTDVAAIFNNDADNSCGMGAGGDMNYVETAEGKLIDAKGVKGRYVRLYSNGNNSNDLNHYIEVEVYGKKSQ